MASFQSGPDTIKNMEGLLILVLIVLVLVFGSKYLKHINKP
jgi:Sec-independent protein translocase protein TatA